MMLLSGCLEPLVLSWLFIFSSVTEIKYKIFFSRSEDSHSSESAHVVISLFRCDHKLISIKEKNCAVQLVFLDLEMPATWS